MQRQVYLPKQETGSGTPAVAWVWILLQLFDWENGTSCLQITLMNKKLQQWAICPLERRALSWPLSERKTIATNTYRSRWRRALAICRRQGRAAGRLPALGAPQLSAGHSAVGEAAELRDVAAESTDWAARSVCWAALEVGLLHRPAEPAAPPASGSPTLRRRRCRSEETPPAASERWPSRHHHHRRRAERPRVAPVSPEDRLLRLRHRRLQPTAPDRAERWGRLLPPHPRRRLHCRRLRLLHRRRPPPASWLADCRQHRSRTERPGRLADEAEAELEVGRGTTDLTADRCPDSHSDPQTPPAPPPGSGSAPSVEEDQPWYGSVPSDAEVKSVAHRKELLLVFVPETALKASRALAVLPVLLCCLALPQRLRWHLTWLQGWMADDHYWRWRVSWRVWAGHRGWQVWAGQSRVCWQVWTGHWRVCWRVWTGQWRMCWQVWADQWRVCWRVCTGHQMVCWRVSAGYHLEVQSLRLVDLPRVQMLACYWRSMALKPVQPGAW